MLSIQQQNQNKSLVKKKLMIDPCETDLKGNWQKQCSGDILGQEYQCDLNEAMPSLRVC
jgi:hypothetical protein